MSKIALIGCSKLKRKGTFPASKLYQGILFRKTLDYCKNKGFNIIYK